MREDDLLEIAVIGRPHGVHGDLHLQLHNPASTLLDGCSELTLVGPTGERRVLRDARVRRRRDKKGGAWLRSAELTTREQAAALTGWKVVVDKSALPALQSDEFYYYELAGFDVVADGGDPVGRVRKVIWTSVDVLEVERPGGAELLVPVVEHYVAAIDRAARRVALAPGAIDNLEVGD